MGNAWPRPRLQNEGQAALDLFVVLDATYAGNLGYGPRIFGVGPRTTSVRKASSFYTHLDSKQEAEGPFQCPETPHRQTERYRGDTRLDKLPAAIRLEGEDAIRGKRELQNTFLTDSLYGLILCDTDAGFVSESSMSAMRPRSTASIA